MGSPKIYFSPGRKPLKDIPQSPPNGSVFEIAQFFRFLRGLPAPKQERVGDLFRALTSALDILSVLQISTLCDFYLRRYEPSNRAARNVVEK